MKVRNLVQVLSGRYEGMAGQVSDVRFAADGSGRVARAQVKIQGCKDGEPVDVLRWFGAAELRVMAP